MDILHILLRIVVLVLSIPFGLLAALIPAYAAGQFVAMIGLPPEIGRYLIGGLVLIVFCAYFQDRITPPKNT